ncbi:MAG: hypothetical protein Q8O37_11425 [Sulfuricellaceae bacterium]|nr:hypothetical protein [Sulfuricellaceae bacterium]
MAKADSLIEQIKKAAKELKAKVAEIDTSIDIAQVELASVKDARITRAEFMELVKEDIRRKGLLFASGLKQETAKRLGTSYFSHDAAMKRPDWSLSIPYLTGMHGVPVEVVDGALYWYFPDIISARFEVAISDMDWPDSDMPTAAKRELIRSIEGRIKALRTERDTLTDELIQAGLAG